MVAIAHFDPTTFVLQNRAIYRREIQSAGSMGERMSECHAERFGHGRLLLRGS